MKRTLTIDPVTRLEGHGKISIFLDDAGDVERAVLQVPELRGFEAFCVGRPAEDLPQIGQLAEQSLPGGESAFRARGLRHSPSSFWATMIRAKRLRRSGRSSQSARMAMTSLATEMSKPVSRTQRPSPPRPLTML